jgi:Tol biopolymer transport system component
VGTGNAQLATGTVHDPLVDATGRFVFFTTAAPVVAADTNAKLDVYRRDRLTGQTVRVSLLGDGDQIDAKSSLCGVSTDGRYVGFQTDAASGDLATQIWRRDLEAGTTVRATRAGSGTSGASLNTTCDLSDDGTRMVFTSHDPSVGCGATGVEQVIVRRFDTGTTACASTSTGGTVANALGFRPVISGSGDLVAFTSIANNLVSGDSNGTYDVFIRQLSTNTLTRITKPGGVQIDGDAQSPAISATGRYVAFSSNSSTLVPDDENGIRDAFRLDRQTGAIERVSVSTAGVEGAGYSLPTAISADGRYVAFTSDAPNLYPADTNGASDVFRRDLVLGRTDLASRRWSSIAAGNDDSWQVADISADGRVVAFTSIATDLGPDDTNGAPDTYVRDFALDLAPFGSTKAFAKQQIADFWPIPVTQEDIDGYAANIQNGSLSPDAAITYLARHPFWTEKRSPLIRLYWAFFLRAPDPSGMQYWTSKLSSGMTLAKAAATFAQSNEFKTKYGSKSNQQFVTLIYQNIFERNPDPAGLAYWTGKLDSKARTRGDVMTSFSESNEGKRFLSPQVDTVNVWLGMLRTMPSKAVLTQWIADIRSGAKVAEQVAATIRTMPAYASRVKA